MPISKDLFLALLSMDSYNRGYGAGIADGKGAVDGDGNDTDGLGGLESEIGAATVKREDGSEEARAAGFYAVAYKVGAGVEGIDEGTTVISYRGTDWYKAYSKTAGGNDLGFGSIEHGGYAIGAGEARAAQGDLALNFYKSVIGKTEFTDDPRDIGDDGELILTGHSMGAGFAGYLAGLYGLEATVYDNMPFEKSISEVYRLAKGPDDPGAPPPAVEDGATQDEVYDYYRGLGLRQDVYHISALSYADGVPWLIDTSRITNTYLKPSGIMDNILASIRGYDVNASANQNIEDIELTLPEGTSTAWSWDNKIGQAHDAGV